MENNIDKQIEQLKNVILQRYNDQIDKIDMSISDAKQSAVDSAVRNRAALIQELDDRLALIKQFPSVLDADFVSVNEVVSKHNNIRIQIQSDIGYDSKNLAIGTWKVLILAKKVD